VILIADRIRTLRGLDKLGRISDMQKR